MNVIDKILSEWSFRCHDGIVDLNDLKKVKILFEILEEDVDDDILNALINTDDDTKTKVLKQLQRIGKEENTELENILKNKELNSSIIEYISLLASKYGLSDELLDYLKSSDKLSLSDLEGSNNLLDTISTKTNFNKNFISKIVFYTPTEKNKGLGIGEIALVLFFNAEKQKIGDIKIDGKTIELKGTEARFPGNGKGRSGDISYLYQELNKKYPDIVLKYKESSLGNYISKIIEVDPDILDDINTKLNDIYPNTDIKITSDNINNTLNKKYVDSYINSHPENDYYMLISRGSSNYTLYTPEELIKAVGEGNIKMTNITKSSSYPQISI
jgi:hypothetical protein